MKKSIIMGWKLLNIGLLICCVISISGMFRFDEGKHVEKGEILYETTLLDAVNRSNMHTDVGTMKTTSHEVSIPEKEDPEGNLNIEPMPGYRSIATDGNSIPMKTAYTTESTANTLNEETVIFSEPVEPRYGFTEEEIYLLTQLLCGSKDKSGDGEYDFDWYVQHGWEPNHLEIGKVLGVVMNRVRSDRWADTVYEVVIQRGQFVVMPRNAKKTPCPLALEVVRAWCEGYDSWDESVQVIPEDHYFFREGPNVTNITRCNY